MRALVVRQDGILLMREAMLESDFESLRAEIDGRLVTKRMQPLRECLDRAGARALANADGRPCCGNVAPLSSLQNRARAAMSSATLFTTWPRCPRPRQPTRMHTRSGYAPRIGTGSHRRARDPAVRSGSRARRAYGPARRGVSFTLS